MSNIKVLRASDPFTGNSHVFSIVASDKEAVYVFPSNLKLFNGEGQLKAAIDYRGETPKKVDDWLDTAKFNLDSYDFEPVTLSDLDNIEDFVDAEQDVLDSEDRVIIPARSISSIKMESAVNALMRSDEEIADYLVEPSRGISEDKYKLIIATMIAAAGTIDLNPWLMPWLNGETNLKNMGFNGLILVRPDAASGNTLSNEAHLKFIEGDSE